MTGNLPGGGTIAGIERVRIETREAAPRAFVLESAMSAEFSAAVSAGVESELRVGDRICGLLRTEDIWKGFDVELEDACHRPELLALLCGGTASAGGYQAAAVGLPVSRVEFDLYLYTADRDSGGAARGYHQWKFPRCKGRPMSAQFKENAFATAKYRLISRPASGEAPLSVEPVAALPEVSA